VRSPRFETAAAVLVMGLSACKNEPRNGRAPFPPTSSASAAASAAPRVEPERPLDASRTAAAAGNRRALDLLKRAAPCPQALPSAFAKYCAHAADFPAAPAGDVPDGVRVLVGLAAVLNPGPASVSTIGTSVPVALVLRGDRRGGGVKQVVLRDPGDPRALSELLGRIGGVLDGRWDHVDVPAALGPQIEALRAGAELSSMERAGGSHWVVDSDTFEMRRANGRWLVIGGPEGPDGPHAVSMFVDELRVLDAKEQSPPTVQVLTFPK
jgi:hypothetical protein